MEAPDYFQAGFSSQFSSDNNSHSTDNMTGVDQFAVDDLLDFPNDDAILADVSFDAFTGSSADSSIATVVDSCNSSSISGSEPGFGGELACRNFPDGHLSGDLCVPYDDLAELEWLSNFVEDSFSSEEFQKLQLISGVKTGRSTEDSKTREFQPDSTRNPQAFHADMSVPAKARSKRSRAAPCNWKSHVLVLSPTTSSSETEAVDEAGKKTVKPAGKKKEGVDGGNGDGRKCLHCATDKTPQWRTGPMGPKTLCNACGVRYKSGRLVPEYRPAASPTFVLTKHSNSHRKVMELRRQKELMKAQQQLQQQQQFLHHHHHHPNMVFDISNGDDYLIHQQGGPAFSQLI